MGHSRNLPSSSRNLPPVHYFLYTFTRSALSRTHVTIHTIFKTRCYDEHEDDPWQYLDSESQDVLAEELKPLRKTCAQWILDNIPQRHWLQHVAIDPCYKLLPKKQERLEELQVAAMGKKKWMSKGSARKGPNLRAPKTAKTQSGSQVTKVEWTPVFARGRLRIYVCDQSWLLLTVGILRR